MEGPRKSFVTEAQALMSQAPETALWTTRAEPSETLAPFVTKLSAKSGTKNALQGGPMSLSALLPADPKVHQRC